MTNKVENPQRQKSADSTLTFSLRVDRSKEFLQEDNEDPSEGTWYVEPFHNWGFSMLASNFKLSYGLSLLESDLKVLTYEKKEQWANGSCAPTRTSLYSLLGISNKIIGYIFHINTPKKNGGSNFLDSVLEMPGVESKRVGRASGWFRFDVGHGVNGRKKGEENAMLGMMERALVGLKSRKVKTDLEVPWMRTI